MRQFVRIPKERLGALIGPSGNVKKRLETRSGAVLEVDSESGEATVVFDQPGDPTKALLLVEVVKAIARGFSPQHASQLFDEAFRLIVIDIRDFSGKSANRVRVVRGRVIGKMGRTRELIEELAEVALSVYGETVAIIGRLDDAEVGREAVEMILGGSEHRAVYAFLERSRRERHQSSILASDRRPTDEDGAEGGPAEEATGDSDE